MNDGTWNPQPKQEKPYTVRLSRLCKGRIAPNGFQWVIVSYKSKLKTHFSSQLIKGTINDEQKEQLGEILYNQIIKGIK
jgi:hypothetical protein